MYERILIWMAVIPGIILLWSIYAQDKIEKEPFKLLLKIMLAGVGATLAAIVIETILWLLFLRPIESFASIYIYQFIDKFFCVALVEEIVKFLAGKLPTWKNKDFNYRFDAVVYMVTSAVTFAIIENIEYSLSGGIIVAMARALTSVPFHVIMGIFMGYYYGNAKYAHENGDLRRRDTQIFLALFVPTCLHGFYDYALSVENGFFILLCLIFIVVLDIVAFVNVRKMSKADVRIVEEVEAEVMPATVDASNAVAMAETINVTNVVATAETVNASNVVAMAETVTEEIDGNPDR